MSHYYHYGLLNFISWVEFSCFVFCFNFIVNGLKGSSQDSSEFVAFVVVMMKHGLFNKAISIGSKFLRSNGLKFNSIAQKLSIELEKFCILRIFCTNFCILNWILSVWSSNHITIWIFLLFNICRCICGDWFWNYYLETSKHIWNDGKASKIYWKE